MALWDGQCRTNLSPASMLNSPLASLDVSLRCNGGTDALQVCELTLGGTLFWWIGGGGAGCLGNISSRSHRALYATVSQQNPNISGPGPAKDSLLYFGGRTTPK